jgi:hypothetical protein
MVCVGDTDILARDTDTYTKYFYTTNLVGECCQMPVEEEKIKKCI